MNDQIRAAKIRTLSEQIVTAIARNDAETDIAVLTSALGVVAGTFAMVTGSPDKFMEQVNACASGIITGSLLDPP